MRMVIALLGAALPLTASAAPPTQEAPEKAPQRAEFAQPAEQCDKFEVKRAGPSKAPEARKLGELPPGNLQLAVMREVDGCYQPTIVRYNFQGGN